jgi:tetratricopeptide (TPR) repeat protein
MSMLALTLALISSPLISSPAEAAEAAEGDWTLEDSSKLWKMRDWGGHTEAAVAMLEAEVAANPDSFDAHYQLSRFYYWQATGLSGDARAERARLGWDEAEHCKRIDASRVEGWYWAAINIGAYANGAGIMASVKQGLGDELEANARKAAAIDAAYDHGGPNRVLGRFFYKLPWPLQDLDQASSLLETANQSDPFCINLVFLAEVYIAQDQDDKARALLEQAAAMDPKETPDPPSTRRHVKTANQLLEDL